MTLNQPNLHKNIHPPSGGYFFCLKIFKNTELTWWRAVVPPPHLGSKYVEYSTKIQPPTFVGKTAVDMAYVRAKSHKIDSTIFYTVSSNFYRKKFIEKSRSKTGVLKSK
ncbi:TPA: hypothetical protein JI091_09330 [Acinetobacter baumannii]|nr:hypothetical protein [Acinetobacter baumannii]